jgi:hypothetical protein
MVWLCMCQDDPVQMDGKGADLELVRPDRVMCAMGCRVHGSSVWYGESEGHMEWGPWKDRVVLWACVGSIVELV